MSDAIDRYLKELTMSDKEKIKVRVNVACGIIMKEGEAGEKLILVIQRAADDHWPLHYDLPRGRCDGGETKNNQNEKLIPCLKREVKEETGLDIIPIQFIDKFMYLADGGTRESTQYNFLCKMKNPNQKIKLSKEHDNFEWVQSVGQVELFFLPEIKKTIVKVLNPDEKIVDYPESDLADNKIKEA